MGLPTPWVRHLADQESRDNFERSVRGSTTALSRLFDLLEETERAIFQVETTAADFTDPAWAFKQAYRNGQKAQIKELKQLLSFVNKDNN